MAKLIDQSIPKFLLVGVLNTLVGRRGSCSCCTIGGLGLLALHRANYLVGGVVSFFLTSTLPSRTRSAAGGRW